MPVIRAPRKKRSIETKSGKVLTRDTQLYVYTEPGKFWRGKNGELCFRIYGEPMPAAKKEVGQVFSGWGQDPETGKRIPQFKSTVIDHDFREVTDPNNPKKKFRYDIGYMRRWTDHCQRCVLELMQQHGIARFGKNQPVAIGMLFYRTQSKSNDLWLPAQKPDKSNYYYAVENALKMTPAITKRYTNGQSYTQPGPFPDGVLFYDDDQVCWTLQPDGKVWATADEPPGVLITVMHCKTISNQIHRSAYPKESQMSLI